MGEWKITGCMLCAQNCGLKVFVEDGKKTKVKPRGDACRKGMKLLYHQYQADRLTHPLKKVGGEFVQVSWDQALDEIAEKMKTLVGDHGPRSLAYVGGSSQGGHMEAAQ